MGMSQQRYGMGFPRCLHSHPRGALHGLGPSGNKLQAGVVPRLGSLLNSAGVYPPAGSCRPFPPLLP